MTEPAENLRIAYQILERNVIRTLRTQRGDSAQLSLQANEALQLLQAAEQARQRFISLILCF
jgi:L-alanine-DL-glutamate epimerase-like enolase superfamily enzyme